MRSRLIAVLPLFLVAPSLAAVLSPSALRTEVSPFLLKPLPSVESIVGIKMPPASPMIVVSSFGDDGADRSVDRGYAIGRTLNVLLFGASPRVDVGNPMFYTLDTSDRGVPVGFARDSRANAYRVARREAAQWCVYGTVGEQRPARVELVVDRCDAGASKRMRIDVASDTDWPQALEVACRFVLESAGALKLGERSAGCERARTLTGTSVIAYGRYAVGANMTMKGLEALVDGDPTFAPAVVDLMNSMPYDGDWRAFVDRRKKLVAGAGPWPALILTAIGRHLSIYGWKIDGEVYEPMYAFIRAHPELRAGWLKLASRLADGAPDVHKPAGAPEHGYYPNEATHSASLSLSLAYYANWPDSYRARWQMGFALQRYAWMLRGNALWKHVPVLGKSALVPLMTLSASFAEDALATQRNAPGLWQSRIVTLYHTGGDWRGAFDQATAQLPRNRGIYETAMEFAQPRWGGTPKDIDRIEALARKNNPGDDWVATLRSRLEWKE